MTSNNSQTVSVSNSFKHRFLAAVAAGELGTMDERGVIVTLKEFKDYFSDIKTQYISSFLPCATIEIGQYTPTRTRFVFRLRKGVYQVHPDALEAHVREFGIRTERRVEEDFEAYGVWIPDRSIRE